MESGFSFAQTKNFHDKRNFLKESPKFLNGKCSYHFLLSTSSRPFVNFEPYPWPLSLVPGVPGKFQ